MSHKISYAQNGEDIVLHRALGHVTRGFYIDVGAYDPVRDSVTKMFYDLDWSGINVEPTPLMFERLCRERPRDVNLDLPVWDRDVELAFFRISQTGLSTLNPAIAEKATAEGREVVATHGRTTTLADICRRHVTGEIHFLKIDVEGSEPQVLSGADFVSFRPWIVVVEATVPGTSKRNDESWRDILQQAGYECVLFDGLNLFFLANEHAELRSSLDAPANCLDEFETYLCRERIAWNRADAEAGARRSTEDTIAWNRADAEAGARRSMEEAIAWNRADAEAGARRSMEEAIAWNRADAEAVARRSMEDTIAWHRADAEAAAHRSVEETIAWHRADAARRAFRSEIDLSATRLHAEAEDALRQKKIAEETLAFLRREKLEDAKKFADARAEFHAIHSRHDHDVAELDRAYRELLAWQEAVRLSTSWRLTRPLRVCGRFLRRFVRTS